MGLFWGESNRLYAEKEGDIKMKGTSLLHTKGKLFLIERLIAVLSQVLVLL